MNVKFTTLETLTYFKQKLDSIFVKKEFKTGSDVEYKTLSDNNLTDDLVEKINNAGSATAVTEEINTAKTEAITESKQYADTVKTEATESAKSYTDAEVSEALTDAKSYADQSETDAIEAAKTYTDEQVSTAKDELQAEVKAQISTAYKVKGSKAFEDLPTPSETEEGNVYNITDAFTTTESFIEGEGKQYPAGSNVVCVEESEGVFKYDVLMGFIDTDVFVKIADIEAITETEIDALFAA